MPRRLLPLVSPLPPCLALCLLFACTGSDDPTFGTVTDPKTVDEDNDGYSLDEDCDDEDAAVNPGSTERCDEVDNDCDEEVDEDGTPDGLEYHPDADGDGYGEAGGVVSSCTSPEGYVGNGDDCDDAENDIYPGHDEFCDDIDNNCDGQIDEQAVDVTTWYADMDGDGYGDPNNTQSSCDQPPGFGLYSTDCNDEAPNINPSVAEQCDDIDNNCNDLIDESERHVFEDADGDGYGNGEVDIVICDVDTPPGYAENRLDCDDENAAVYPDAEEVEDGLDNDCDTEVDEDSGTTDPPAEDEDEDGYTSAEGDCDDADATISPAEDEICDDGVDQNCDGLSNSCGPSGDWSASDAAAALLGVSGEDHAANALALPGDVDGDGVGDALVAASESDAPGTDGGVAYIVLGPIAGSSSLGDADAVLEAAAAGDRFGISVSGAGDGNDDGYRDLFVGAFQADDGGADSGSAYLFLGPVAGTLSAASADAMLAGEAASDAAGYAVSGAGDVNGDGEDDVLVGAKSNATTATTAGATYLWSGGLSGSVSLADAPTRLLGHARGDLSGIAVAGGADQDGDGVPDVLVGATHQDSGGSNAGAAYVVSGDVSGDVDLNDGEGRLLGELASDEAGTSVAWAGDVDGDGHGDALIGAQYADAAATDAGAAYLVYGPHTGDLSLSSADVRLLGVTSKDRAGTSVSGAGDIDQDGYSDVFIGAFYEDSAERNAGAAYLLYGPLSGSASLSSAEGRALGIAEDDRLGGAVAGGDDLDGDGADDLLVGAHLYDGATTDAGGAFLFQGGGL